MISLEQLVDFDDLDKPIKLWVDYGNDGVDEGKIEENGEEKAGKSSKFKR